MNHSTRPAKFGIRLPVAGVGFACAFVFAVFAWLMQLSTFWLPVLTGDVRYGHGVCIKLADTQPNGKLSLLSASHSAHLSASELSNTHMQHDMSHSDHSSHERHEHQMMSASAHDKATILLSTPQGTADSAADNGESNHCDICMLLASVSSLDVFDGFRFDVVQMAQVIAARWSYRQHLETTLDYLLPPSRAPPIFS